MTSDVKPGKAWLAAERSSGVMYCRVRLRRLGCTVPAHSNGEERSQT